MADLGVNVDHVATVRQARRAVEPDPIAAAVLAEIAGARCVTVHLREDRRHVQERDVRILREIVQTRLNLEMCTSDDLVRFALDVRPDSCTLVPERREELTTEGGLDVTGGGAAVARAVERLKAGGIRVHLFVDAVPERIEASAGVCADGVELHTGPYALARGKVDRAREIERIHGAIAAAVARGLRVNAGHGLTYGNVPALASIPEIEEFQIGHSIVARAVLVGMERAVREMVDLVSAGGGR